jgi:phosphopantothenoylcysteine decarboxylase/phosphopantothenate--cysteine ligase
MGSNILIAVTGSISAYKIADVVSELGKRGHQVQCILTESAAQFVTPLVL